MITTRVPTESDVVELVKNMRPMDRLETRVFCEKGETVKDRVQRSVKESTVCWAVLDGDELICIYGYQSIKEKNKRGEHKHRNKLRDIGLVWCLGTELIEKHGREFTRVARKFIDEVAALHREGIYNMIHADNTLSRKWLKACGCFVFKDAPLTLKGQPFTWFKKVTGQTYEEMAGEAYVSTNS